MDMLRSAETGQNVRAASRLEQAKILIQYAGVTVLSLIGGGAFTYFLKAQDYLAAFNRVYVHFTFPFSECQHISNALKLLLRYSLFSLSLAFLVFLFSFSVWNHFASQLLLVCEGGKVGFSCVLLGRMACSETIREYVSIYAIAVYVAASFILLIACFWYVFRMANDARTAFSHTLEGRAVIESRDAWRLFGCFLRYGFGLILLYSIYGLLIFLL